MPATPPNRPLLSLVVATLAAVAATAVAAPATAAAPAGGATGLSAAVAPTSVAPGGRVGLLLRGCGSRTGTASSSAFGDVRLGPSGSSSTLSGSTTVFTNAGAGTYTVTFECGGPGGGRVTAPLQVTTGAARGGTGGSIHTVSRAEMAVGGTLTASALAAGIWLLRRRARAS
ncbi:hypothetical protein AB0953_16830 [Streptomyces sp. NPDC046866]|uniref:hypothetical protein n=1 Tax=Streptomyces sp. NPDC046866 TaxID=3154921 RepID=UPI0034571AC8